MNLVQGSEQHTLLKRVSETDTITVMMAEYNTLRAEILKRIELMHQVASLGLVVPTTIFAFGFQTRDANIIFLYPLLALVLAILWSQHDRRSRECGYYIQTRIESRLEQVLSWEHFMNSTRTAHSLFDRDALWAAVGIFAGTGVLAIIVGIPLALIYPPIAPLWVLLFLAILAIVLILAKLFSPYTHPKRMQPFSHILFMQQK